MTVSIALSVAISFASLHAPTAPLAEGPRAVRDDALLATAINLPPDPSLRWIDEVPEVEECFGVRIGIRLTPSDIWVGLSVGDRRQIAHIDGAPDWDSLTEALDEYRRLPAFDDPGMPLSVSMTDDVVAATLAHALRRIKAADFEPRFTVLGWEPVAFGGGTLATDFPRRAFGKRSVAVLVSETGIVVGDDRGGVEFIASLWPGRDDTPRLRQALRELAVRGGPTTRVSFETSGRIDPRRLKRAERAARRVGLPQSRGPFRATVWHAAEALGYVRSD